MRKIIQLSTATCPRIQEGEGPGDANAEVAVAALSDDGSAWMVRTGHGSSRWEALPPIAQGQSLEAWLVEVSKYVTRNDLMRYDAIETLIKDRYKILVGKFQAGISPETAASELNQCQMIDMAGDKAFRAI